MLKYCLISLLVVSAAFAVSTDKITGSGITGAPSMDLTRAEECIFDQGVSSPGNGAWGSMWYQGMAQDMKVADNFSIDSSYDGYQLTSWVEWFCVWYGSLSEGSSKGYWGVIYEDGGSTPATTEPYEYGSSAGWHSDLEGGGGGLDYITDVVAADYWPWSVISGTGSPDFYLWGAYPCYKTGAAVEDAESGGWDWMFDTETVYWYAGQFYAPSTPYAGPPDGSPSLVSGGMVQAGVSGASWSNVGYPMMFQLFGDVGIPDETPPVITDMFPQDADYPSGVPTDATTGCHWTEPDENDRGIDVDASAFDLYDSNMDPVLGTLNIDDADTFDVSVEFEPDGLNEGETYTVETTAVDLAGNDTTETWEFTTGYMNIAPASLGSIKAGFAQ
jgi:hypothetical protein